MAVGKDAAVGEQASRDSGPLIVSRPLAIDPPRQQLKADDAGVVEGNDDGLRYPLGVPEGFDEIRALEGRVRVIPGFVGVAVADVVQVDAGESGIASSRKLPPSPNRRNHPASQAGTFA